MRRLWESAGWLGLVAVLWGSDLLAKLGEQATGEIAKDSFTLISGQVTSAIAVLLMIPFLAHWLRQFPLRMDQWPRTVIGHTLGSIIFAFGHYALIVVLRAIWYSLQGREYIWREPFVANLVVEYQKDIKIYIGFVIVIAAYRYFLSDREPEGATATDRLVVQTGTGDAVLRFDQIDYLEAARNYVSIFSGDREYVLRDTMANIEQRLAAGPFVRTHRSYIVNVEKVAETRTIDGVTRIILDNGREIPVSRTYRGAFNRAMLTGT